MSISAEDSKKREKQQKDRRGRRGSPSPTLDNALLGLWGEFRHGERIPGLLLCCCDKHWSQKQPGVGRAYLAYSL